MSFRSPLYEEHRRSGARIVDFAGWEMPLFYSGVIAEHRAVRQAAGVFDVSHLGKAMVAGAGAERMLDRLFPGKVARLEEWEAGYNLLLNDQGGIIDDLFIYRRPEGFLVVPNAANTPAALEVLAAAAVGSGATVEDSRQRWAIIALQGPRSPAIAAQVFPEAVSLSLHRFADLVIDGAAVQVARTGYTGEYGFELFVPWAEAPKVWGILLDAGGGHGILPAGLGARDTLRLEMGYPLHGQEISAETDPVEAGLSWVIDWDKDSYPGAARLKAARQLGPKQRLRGFIALEPGIPRHGHAILHEGEVVGEVTSGNMSPVLGKGIGMGYLPSELGAPGTILSVDVRGKMLPVEVTKPPFIPKRA